MLQVLEFFLAVLGHTNIPSDLQRDLALAPQQSIFGT